MDKKSKDLKLERTESPQGSNDSEGPSVDKGDTTEVKCTSSDKGEERIENDDATVKESQNTEDQGALLEKFEEKENDDATVKENEKTEDQGALLENFEEKENDGATVKEIEKTEDQGALLEKFEEKENDDATVKESETTKDQGALLDKFEEKDNEGVSVEEVETVDTYGVSSESVEISGETSKMAKGIDESQVVEKPSNLEIEKQEKVEDHVPEASATEEDS